MPPSPPLAAILLLAASACAPRQDPRRAWVPADHGDAVLSVRQDGEGHATGWQAVNTLVVPWQQVWLDDARLASLSRLPCSGGRLLEQRVRSVDPLGVRAAYTLQVLDSPCGDWLLAVQGQADLVFDPPVPSLPMDLAAGTAWSGEGALGAGTWRYEARARAEKGSPCGPCGSCLLVEDRMVLATAAGPVSDRSGEQVLCRDIGVVSARGQDAVTGAWDHSALVRTTRGYISLDAPAPDPHPLDPTPSLPLAPPDTWQVSRDPQARVAEVSVEATSAPLVVPGPIPLVVASSWEGDVVAFEAPSQGGAWVQAWRFQPKGTVFTGFALDPDRGTLLFGTTAKRLYAVDVGGLYVWSVPTPDAVSTRPKVAKRRVVVGCEDGTVLAVDPATGETRWEAHLGEAAAGSPVVVGDVVALGTDGGTVEGLELATGQHLWSAEGDDAFEAALVVDGDQILAASRYGRVHALDPATGEEIWRSPAVGTLRYAPAVSGGQVWVVDTSGTLLILPGAGSAWIHVDLALSGPLVTTSWGILAPDQGGRLLLLGDGGKVLQSWDLWDDDGQAALRLDPALGAGAAWLVDGWSRLWRVGP